MKTNNKTVLLAILAVFAMVAAGAAVVMASSEDVDATSVTKEITATALDTTGKTVTAEDKIFVALADGGLKLTAADVAGATVYLLTGKNVTLIGAADGQNINVILCTAIVAATDGKFNVTYEANVVEEVPVAVYKFTVGALTAGNSMLLTANPDAKTVTYALSAGAPAMVGYGILVEGTTKVAYAAGQDAGVITANAAAVNVTVMDGSFTIKTSAAEGGTPVVAQADFTSIKMTGAPMIVASTVDGEVTVSDVGATDADGAIAVTAEEITLADGLKLYKIVPTGYTLDDMAATLEDPVVLEAAKPLLHSGDVLTLCGSLTDRTIALSEEHTVAGAAKTIAVGSYLWTGDMQLTLTDTHATKPAKAVSASMNCTASTGSKITLTLPSVADAGNTPVIGTAFTIGNAGKCTLKSNATATSQTVAAETELTVAAGVKLTAETAFTVNGTLNVLGDVDAGALAAAITGTVNLDGTFKAGAMVGPAGKFYIGTTGSLDCTSYNGTVQSAVVNDEYATPIGGIYNYDFTIVSGAPVYLNKDLVIPEGVTFTIKSGGILALNGHQLTLEGALDVQQGGAVVALGYDNSDAADEQIIVSYGADLSIDGIVGLGGNGVTLAPGAATTTRQFAGTVTLQNVTGVEMTYAAITTNYGEALGESDIITGMGHPVATAIVAEADAGMTMMTLKITGNVTAFTGTGSTATKMIELGQFTVLGNTTIGTSVALQPYAAGSIVLKGCTLDVDGVATGKIDLDLGATLDMAGGKTNVGNAEVKTLNVTAFTGKYAATATPAAIKTLGRTAVNIVNAGGAVVESATATESTTTGVFTVATFELSGTITEAYTATGITKIAQTKIASAVPEPAAPDAGEGITQANGIVIAAPLTSEATPDEAAFILDATGTKLDVVGLGIVAVLDGGVKFDAATTTASTYTIKATKTIFYMEPFEDALATLATTDAGITVYGSFDLPSMELASAKPVTIDATASLNIPGDAVVVVQKDGKLVGVVNAVTGKLVVMEGATVSAPNDYYAKTTTEDQTVYSGLQVALQDAPEGAVISVVKAVDMATSNLTVPAGKTLKMTDYALTVKDLNVLGTLTSASNVTVKGALTVGEDGEFEMEAGKLTVAKTTAVNGLMDLSEGTATYEFNDKVTADGAFKFKAGGSVNNMVGAYVLDAGVNILSTLPVAAALADEGSIITIVGKYSYTSAIEMPAGTTLRIAVGAEVSLGAVDITDAQVAVAEGGLLSATFTGNTASIDTSVTVVKMTVGAFSDLETTDAYGLTYNQMLVADDIAADALNVTAGAVIIATDGRTINSDVVVGSDAMLTVNEDAVINGSALFTGDLIVAEGKTLDINAADEHDMLIIAGEAGLTGAIDATGVDTLISGDVDIIKGTTKFGDTLVTGTVEIAKGATLQVANLAVGVDDIGANGTIAGEGTLTIAGAVVLYPGASVDDALLEDCTYSTILYVNGAIYTVAYAAAADVPLANVIPEEDLVIPGYNMAGSSNIANWKNLAGTAATGKFVGQNNFEVIYFQGVEQTATVKVSVATGMSIYVDGVKYASGTDIPNMAMGAHTVSVTVNPGYKYADGTTATITFDGKVLSGLLVFNITTDMANKTVVLSAIGDIVVDQPDYPEQEKEDNSMIMILLAVLVVMVVILAIVTVIRMMRS